MDSRKQSVKNVKKKNPIITDNDFDEESTEMETLYRGMSLDHDELDQYAEMENKTINLKGFASTSTDKKKALEFAFYNEKDEN